MVCQQSLVTLCIRNTDLDLFAQPATAKDMRDYAFPVHPLHDRAVLAAAVLERLPERSPASHPARPGRILTRVSNFALFAGPGSRIMVGIG
jgi:hypothetical protein